MTVRPRLRAAKAFARLALAAALAAAANAAVADEPGGCAAHRWPLDRERAALAAARTVVQNGGALRYGAVASLELAPFADAELPRAPERAPKFQPSYAGHFTLPVPDNPGRYTVTLAANAWIDVIDNGAFLHPKAFSAAPGCEGARKSVKFDLPARPLDVQLSGVKDAEIAVIVTPDE